MFLSCIQVAAELPPTPKLVIKNLAKEKEPEPERSKTPKPPKVVLSSDSASCVLLAIEQGSSYAKTIGSGIHPLKM